MKQILFSMLLLLGISAASCSQNNYSNYNGQKWEQLEGSGKLITLNPAIGSPIIIQLSPLKRLPYTNW